MSKQTEELKIENLEAQVEVSETPEMVEPEKKEIDNKKIAATITKQNPERAKEIARERLSKMTPEQIAALRAAKNAKLEEERAAKRAAEEALERLRVEEIQKKQLSEEQKLRIMEQLSKLTAEELEAVKENRAAKHERDQRLAEIETAKSSKKSGKKVKKSKGRRISYESKQAFTGFMFVLPWFIGFLMFFAIPCLQSLQFSFSKVSVFDNYACTWYGLGNYTELLTSGASYLQSLTSTLTNLAVNVPIVLIFSLFVAVLLNRKFAGRGVVRAIFFLPVIVTTGVVMSTFNSKGDANAVLEGNVGNGVLFEVANASEFLVELGLNETLTEYMTMVADRIFDVVWDSGIQILLFLAALQGISPSLYEASDVEGATAWETFWLITFPNVAPIILVNIVYTIVDTFSDTSNAVMKEINKMLNSTFNYGGAAAASWTFFLMVLLIIGVVFLLFKVIGKNND